MTTSWYVGQLFSNGGVFLLILMIPMLWLEKNKRLSIKTFTALITTFVLIEIVKHFIPTERPFVGYGIDVPLSLVKANDSFPSGHTGVAFAIATSVWLAKHRLGFAMLVLALLVGIGRVLLWVHFPIDVIVGGSLGAIIALVLSEVFKTRKRNFRS